MAELFVIFPRRKQCLLMPWDAVATKGGRLKHSSFPIFMFEMHGIYDQSAQRISATGWLLFMRCVSLAFIGLFLRWTPAETVEAILAKILSGCDSATYLTKCKARYSKVWKRSATFKQTECFVFFVEVFAAILSPTPKLNQWKGLCLWKNTHKG